MKILFIAQNILNTKILQFMVHGTMYSQDRCGQITDQSKLGSAFGISRIPFVVYVSPVIGSAWLLISHIAFLG